MAWNIKRMHALSKPGARTTTQCVACGRGKCGSAPKPGRAVPDVGGQNACARRVDGSGRGSTGGRRRPSRRRRSWSARFPFPVQKGCLPTRLRVSAPADQELSQARASQLGHRLAYLGLVEGTNRAFHFHARQDRPLRTLGITIAVPPSSAWLPKTTET
jgi:hypothetical protein